MKTSDRMGIGSLLAAVCLSLLSTVISTASGEYIQFTFTGEVTEVAGSPWDPWYETQIGDPIEVQYIVDSNAEDQIPGSDLGRYDFMSLSFSINNVPLVTGDGYIVIEYDPSYQDFYTLHFEFGSGILGNIQFIGTDMLYSDELPLDVEWTQYAFWQEGAIANIDVWGRIDYQFTSYEAVVVPSTPTFFLLLFSTFCGRRRL